MPYTLVVVDMQPAFHAASKSNVLVNVAREIILAKRSKSAIVFLEYEGSGATTPALMALTEGYALRANATKYQDDGSGQVVKVLNRREFPSRRLKVCGVNSNACVYATVNGLLDKLEKSKIEVVKDACEWTGSGEFEWERYFSHRNLRLV